MSFAVLVERTVQEEKPLLVKFLPEIRLLAVHMESELCKWVFARDLIYPGGAP